MRWLRKKTHYRQLYVKSAIFLEKTSIIVSEINIVSNYFSASHNDK
jgi:hypothetical protein